MCSAFADFGVEHSVPIDNLDSSAIDKKLEALVKKGESMPRYICAGRFELYLVSRFLASKHCKPCAML